MSAYKEVTTGSSILQSQRAMGESVSVHGKGLVGAWEQARMVTETQKMLEGVKPVAKWDVPGVQP